MIGEAPLPPAAISEAKRESFDVVVIGAGQAGLSVGYHLLRRNVNFVILEANDRIGDQWRNRWDSLRLFTPAKFDGLDGMRFPAPMNSFPTKDEMADYLEAYASRFRLPVRTGIRVDSLSQLGERFVVMAGDNRFEAAQVVVAAASYQAPHVPPFAQELDPGITQLHSHDYRNRSQLPEGGVLLVGAGNSGSEIAKELAPYHRVWMSGRDVGQIPFRIEGFLARVLLVRLVVRGLFHRVLTLGTPIGRKAHPKIISHGGPLIRVKQRDLAALGVERIPRIAGVRDGKPLVADGHALDVSSVIWCTGFHLGLSWIDLDILDDEGRPKHERGIASGVPGLYFVGLHFLYSLSSSMIHGVGRDAGHVAHAVATALARKKQEAARPGVMRDSLCQRLPGRLPETSRPREICSTRGGDGPATVHNSRWHRCIRRSGAHRDRPQGLTKSIRDAGMSRTLLGPERPLACRRKWFSLI